MGAVDETPAAELCRRGEFAEATTWILKSYGSEIMTYLLSLERRPAEAQDVFGEFADALWRSLPTFRWECSLRTFAYALARRHLARSVRARVRRRVEVPLGPDAEEIAERLRTATAEYLRSEVHDRLQRLRATLDDDARTLLILRLNRRLGWEEIARVMADGDVTQESLARDAAALRKRFERLKDQLRKELRDAPPE
jgi:RNA polymerase sigma-70 factor, ECF subfamily